MLPCVSHMRRLVPPLALVLLVLAAPLIAGAGAGATPDLWQAAGAAQTKKPVRAPAFTLQELGGRPVALQQLRGRVVMLYFWATW